MKAAFGSQGWAAVPQLVSYQLILSGEQDDTHPLRIIAKCPIHGHVGLADGSVHAGSVEERHKARSDGGWTAGIVSVMLLGGYSPPADRERRGDGVPTNATGTY